MSIQVTLFNPAKQGLGYLPVHYSDGTMSVYTYHPDCDDSKRAMLLDINRTHNVWLISGRSSKRDNYPSIKRVDCIDQLINSYGSRRNFHRHDLEYRIVCILASPECLRNDRDLDRMQVSSD